MLAVGWAVCARAADGDALRRGFQAPPREARPALWWRFMDDYVSREGIVADVECMRRLGISGGVVSFCASDWNTMGLQKDGMPYVPILSKAWFDMIGFQLAQSADVGLDLWFQACPGYATAGGPWNTPEHSMQKLVWSETACEGGKPFVAVLARPAVDKKWNYYRDVAVLAFPKVGAKEAITPETVLDLTEKMDATGRLKWQAPAGSWKIMRLGHTTTGVPNHPVTPQGKGLECDKLSREATRIHFDSYFKKILDQRPAAAGKPGKVELFYDSWEADSQNWTPQFREEFRKRRGYDPLPWLPVVTGQLVGSEALSRRFDSDWKMTVEEMINSEHFAELARLCHENGCQRFRGQPYNGPVNFMTAGAIFDIPEGEFWHSRKDYGWWTLRLIASVAHVNGKTIASAEALTTCPEDLRFDVDPFSTKAETDLAFTMGINQLAIPHIPHNPWPKLKPGMCVGPYGMLLGGGQVWADLAESWVTYLGRCSYLLQQGTFAADVVRQFRPSQKGYEPPVGYAGDLCNEEVIVSAMTWDGTALCLPGGMRYRLLELADTTKTLGITLSPSGIERRLDGKAMPQSLSLPLLRKVRELVMAGAAVVGPRPQIAAGLAGYPESDREVTHIADELWGPAAATGPLDRQIGKGRVFSGIPVAEALARLGIQPDFKTVGPAAADLPWIHRRLGENDLYFVSNQRNERLTVTASFRVDGKTPELWHADTGTVEPVRAWTYKNGRTEVTLEFDPCGSVFVVFRPGMPQALPMQLAAPTVLGTVPLSEGWKVHFPAGMGAPTTSEFPKLVSWAERPEKGIRYYSGIAVYERQACVPAELLKPGCKTILNLGEVKNLARVTVNGTAFPELWKPPFRCDITAAVKPGVNQIAVEVVNLWVNRLIGDEREPADVKWGKPAYGRDHRFSGQPLVLYPDWMRHGTPRPSKERYTFTTRNYVQKEQPLLPSGLLGPVVLRAETIP